MTSRTITAASPSSGKNRVDFDRVLAAARRAPLELTPIEWDGAPHSSAASATTPAQAAFAMSGDLHGTGEVRRLRIRDRYIGARFPGAARSAMDLESAERVIKSARLYFEDGRLETALELLELAIEQDPRAEGLWLAKLEILFLARDAKGYTECATAFRAEHGASAQWGEVARLGHALAPGEAIFGPRRGPRSHDHYGPWPHLPNWIQASWDLTSEVLASDFHRLLGESPAALAA
jgi:hypothetical protein